jgi:hypothetical protein
MRFVIRLIRRQARSFIKSQSSAIYRGNNHMPFGSNSFHVGGVLGFACEPFRFWEQYPCAWAWAWTMVALSSCASIIQQNRLLPHEKFH